MEQLKQEIMDLLQPFVDGQKFDVDYVRKVDVDGLTHYITAANDPVIADTFMIHDMTYDRQTLNLFCHPISLTSNLQEAIAVVDFLVDRLVPNIEVMEGTIDAAGGYSINGKPFIGDEHEALVDEARGIAYATGRKVEDVLVQIMPGESAELGDENALRPNGA
ncbi:MAG: hypothetical protein Q8O64_05825 [Sideroxyarcus sp.]|nr:hypothetical protein [Sideroxyarcus sp.]